MTLTLVDQAVASGARISQACAYLQVTPRTLQRWRAQGPDGGEDRRRGPHKRPPNALSAAERKDILAVANSEPYPDLSPKQLVPKLADQGIYLASESTFRRVLEAEGQSTHRQPTKPRTCNKPQERVATGPGQLLCWDITYLPTTVRGRFYYLYVFLDIWGRKIVGWGVHDEQCGDFAAQLLEATCDQLGAATADRVLHSDNGKPMKGSSMLSAMQWLGIVPSFSRPHVSDDNPYAEAVFRTLKYRPACSGIRFDSLDEAVAWVDHLVRWYNHQHLHSAIGFVAPHDRHIGADVAILEARKALYKRAHRAHPERWTRDVRAWDRPVKVSLHPNRPTIVLQPRAEGRAA